jgi:hypothetical protein
VRSLNGTYACVLKAASAAGVKEAQIKTQILDVITEDNSGIHFILATLKNRLVT